MLLRRWGPLVAALVATIVLGLGASLGASAAQGTTNADNHPAHIHTGSCAQLGDVEFPLGNVGMMGMMGGGMMGTPGAGMMMTPGAGMMMGSPQVGMMGGMMGTPGAGMTMGPMWGRPRPCRSRRA